MKYPPDFARVSMTRFNGRGCLTEFKILEWHSDSLIFSKQSSKNQVMSISAWWFLDSDTSRKFGRSAVLKICLICGSGRLTARICNSSVCFSMRSVRFVGSRVWLPLPRHSSRLSMTIKNGERVEVSPGLLAQICLTKTTCSNIPRCTRVRSRVFLQQILGVRVGRRGAWTTRQTKLWREKETFSLGVRKLSLNLPALN